MVKLISTARHWFHDRWLKPNDPFEATEEEAEELMSKPIGFAVRDTQVETVKPKRNSYKRRDMEAEE